MKLLLDTHIFLWFVQNSPKLPGRWYDFIETSGHRFLISHVVPWEISIKHGLGKLKLDRRPSEIFPAQVEANGFEFLPITLPHVLRQGELPPHHGDPFDRLLVAQCQIERIKIISLDPQLHAYEVVLPEP
ncbi:type II toxin-antitoxin system VapC family toxin [Phragmitibacter flavus]|uniref:Type II toxin-antitoxin system VapC family toxin n=1 Tax=Phragmitibacter flavus TaxID=2576071 RepID=A0A5R8KFA7_9BACT|nr:type II toxin-antitoxin system VapC family toxin [Phragmitibacter flavus]TLD70973.1 type II toxin-antitoxin system VapC family toxin [Phragmitibacter flavus]